MTYKITLPFCFMLALISGTLQAATERWYDSDQVSQGEILFLQNCASCHGDDAEATSGWQQGNGAQAAPPLNGSAHTWHHSLEQLTETIQQGSIQIGGAMPSFEGKLSNREINHVISYFQSKWPDDIYSQWAKNFEVSAPTKDITELLQLRLGNIDIAPATKTDIEGVYQTQFGDRYAYLIEDGRYVFIGDLVDLKEARNITELSRRSVVKESLANVNASDLIIYPAEGKEQAVLNVFTDTSCAFCQRLHAEVAYLQQAGISVRYFPFPRGGNRGPGYADLKSVWCSADRNEAMDIAKGLSTGQLGAGNCNQAGFVDAGFDLGRKLGITGTPSLFATNGTKFNGYVPHKELIPMLLNQH